MPHSTPRSWFWLPLLGLLAAFLDGPALADERPSSKEELARLIADRLKASRGLALDIGCGDAGLAVAITRRTELTVECVESDAEAVKQVRRSVDEAGLYGIRLTASEGNLGRLNYPSLSARLVLCGDEFVQGKRGRDFKELYRVLSPGGVAWVGQGAATAKKGQALTRVQLEAWLREAGITTYEIVEEQGLWACVTRPRSKGWDEWTHRGHDPANTFGSADTVAGPDFRTHWVSDFRPGLSSAAVAVAGGRVILASLSYDEFPDTTPHIQVLDAYSGVELWARVGRKELPIERPPGMYSNRESCCDMVAVGDDLYLLGGKYCHVFDLNTGKIKRSIAVPKEAKPEADDVWLYLSCVGDNLYGGVGKSPKIRADWNTMTYRGESRAVFAMDRNTDKVGWVNRTPASVCSLTVGDGRMYLCEQARKLHALDTATGKVAWTTPLSYETGTEVAGCAYYHDKVWLLYNRPLASKDRKGGALTGAALLTAGHNKRELDAYSAKDGKHLFKGDFGILVAGVSYSNGLVFGSGQHSGQGVSVLDANTGAPKWKLRDSFKCTPSLASPNCFLVQKGSFPSILDLKSLGAEPDPAKAQRTSFTGFRPSCSFPGIPANGLIYHQAEGCACASPIRGNIALIPGEPAPFDTKNRLVKGSAFGQRLPEGDRRVWATWRADSIHSARTEEAAPEAMELLWKKEKLPGKLTPLAVGDGQVFFGSTARKLFALDAATGQQSWQRIGEGRIQVAPFLWRGRLYVSDDEGGVSCLRADKGESIWEFRAALGRERIVGYGGFMSRWPARTGVLVHDDTAYFAAGFFPDEGTAVYAVDARTGELRWEKGFNVAKRGSRTAGFVPDGALALANNRLYVPSGSGKPWQVELDKPEHDASFTTGNHVKGHQIMVAGKDLLGVTPGLQYVHHVHYIDSESGQLLPVVTPDTIYLLNQGSASKGFYLTAGKREAYEFTQKRTAVYTVKREPGKQSDYLRWKAWKNAPMNCLIETSGTLFSGGPGKVYATRTADGKELWSASVPGNVEDLAFQDGRLFVTCDSGAVLCFGKKP